MGGELEELPEEFVAASITEGADSKAQSRGEDPQEREQTKAEKNHAVLDTYPEMKAALTVHPMEARPSLQEFLGWMQVLTHQRHALMRDTFQGVLAMPGKRAKLVQIQVKMNIKQIQKNAA